MQTPSGWRERVCAKLYKHFYVTFVFSNTNNSLWRRCWSPDSFTRFTDHLQLWFKWSEISPKAATNNCSSLHHLIVLKLLVLYNQQSKTPKYFLYYVRNQEIFTHKKLEQLNSLLIHLSLQHLSTAVSSWGFLKAPGFWRTAMIFLIFVLYIDNVFVFTWLHETPESLKCLNLKLH